jgi:hypothetical protein
MDAVILSEAKDLVFCPQTAGSSTSLLSTRNDNVFMRSLLAQYDKKLRQLCSLFVSHTAPATDDEIRHPLQEG